MMQCSQRKTISKPNRKGYKVSLTVHESSFLSVSPPSGRENACAIVFDVLAVVFDDDAIVFNALAVVLDALAVVVDAFAVQLDAYAIVLDAFAVQLDAYAIVLDDDTVVLDALTIVLDALAMQENGNALPGGGIVGKKKEKSRHCERSNLRFQHRRERKMR